MNVACCEDGCRGIPNDNVPLFVSHLILVTLATASWILCAAVLKDDWPTHVESWLVFNLALAAAETLYGAWACVVDARDTTFFERSTRSFLIADGVFATMQLAVAVTGAAYWRGGGSSSDEVFDCAVVLAWFALACVALARLDLEYALVCVVAVVLGTANAIGYTKCSKDAQARISSFARTTLINSILHRFV